MAEKRSQFRNRYGLSEDTIALGIIGRIVPVKNHLMFIRAVEHVLKNTNCKIRAFIIGDGLLKSDLQKELNRMHIDWNENETGRCVVCFTGWITDIDRALAGLDVVCLTSVNEGTPVSLIEAQAAGKPIVSTNVGGIRDILNPDAGLLSEPGQQDEFNANLRNVVENFGEWKEKAVKAGPGVFESFGYERLCGGMKDLYRELLEN